MIMIIGTLLILSAVAFVVAWAVDSLSKPSASTLYDTIIIPTDTYHWAGPSQSHRFGKASV